MNAPRRGTRRPDASRAGQALVEFALVMPLLLILLLGVVEFGRAWNAYQVVTDAAREATRTAVVYNPGVTVDSIYAVVDDALTRAGLDPAEATSSVSGFQQGRGTTATVSVAYQYAFVFLRPLMGWVGSDGVVTLKTNCSMRNE